MCLSSDVRDHQVNETLSVAADKPLLGSSPLPRGGGPGPWQAWLLPLPARPFFSTGVPRLRKIPSQARTDSFADTPQTAPGASGQE